MRAAAALAFAVALRMSLAGRGGSEDEVEEVDEAEDEEEVVDAGWAVMRAGLRAAASAAATAGRMEGMSPGCRLGAGGWGGPVVTWRPGGPIWSAAAGEGGAGLRPSLSGVGWARVLQCARSCGLVSAGGNSSRGLHSGAGGGGPGSSGVCVGGVGGPLGWVVRYSRVFPLTKKVDGEGVLKEIFEGWVQVYGLPKIIHSDQDIRFTSPTGWY